MTDFVTRWRRREGPDGVMRAELQQFRECADGNWRWTWSRQVETADSADANTKTTPEAGEAGRPFKIGDMVRLNSCDMAMTVLHLDCIEVTCAWMRDGEWMEQAIHRDCLTFFEDIPF